MRPRRKTTAQRTNRDLGRRQLEDAKHPSKVFLVLFVHKENSTLQPNERGIKTVGLKNSIEQSDVLGDTLFDLLEIDELIRRMRPRRLPRSHLERRNR